MRRVYFVLCLIMLLSCAEIALAQKIIYVSGEGDDNSTTPGIFTTPYKTIVKALLEAQGETEIRVMEGVYRLEEELKIPSHVKVLGGYQDEVREGNAAEKTSLIGNGMSRVVRLGGVLDGVTIKGGHAAGMNGGGVYVQSGGRLVNCIITENSTAYRLPNVGDLLKKDNTYISVSEFDPKEYKDIAGVFFWINPDQKAEPGNQGMAMSIANYLSPWGANIDSEGCFLGTAENAIRDLNGWQNTDELIREGGCDAAIWCRTQGGNCFLPSMGQILMFITEWGELEKTYSQLWTKMHKEYVVDGTIGQIEMQDFFGTGVRYYKPKFLESRFYVLMGSLWGSSTRKKKDEFWSVSGILMNCDIVQQDNDIREIHISAMIKF